MKKSILVIAAALLTVAASAQNKMWLSGQVGYSSESYDPGDTKITGGTFGPAFGYMVNDKIAVGLGLTYSSMKTEKGNEGGALNYNEKTENGLSINPFVRYYKMMADNKLGLYGEFNLGIGSGTTSWDGVTDSNGDPVTVEDIDYSNLNITIAPGIQYWFADSWSINAQMGILSYNSRNDKDQGVDDNGDTVDQKTNNMDFGLDFSRLNFALNYHF